MKYKFKILTAVAWKYELEKLSEKILTAVAWKTPKCLAYWCAIRVLSHATVGQYSDTIVPELTVIDALKRWDT